MPWISKIVHAIKAAYRKWYDWEFGWEREQDDRP